MYIPLSVSIERHQMEMLQRNGSVTIREIRNTSATNAVLTNSLLTFSFLIFCLFLFEGYVLQIIDFSVSTTAIEDLSLFQVYILCSFTTIHEYIYTYMHTYKCKRHFFK